MKLELSKEEIGDLVDSVETHIEVCKEYGDFQDADDLKPLLKKMETAYQKTIPMEERK